MRDKRPALTARMIADYCRLRLQSALPATLATKIGDYLTILAEARTIPPMVGKKIDWDTLAVSVECDTEVLLTRQRQIKPILDAVIRNARLEGLEHAEDLPQHSEPPRPRKPRTVPEFPEPSSPDYEDCDDFGAALGMHLHRFRENVPILIIALGRKGVSIDTATLYSWIRGDHLPRELFSLRVLELIEERYRLPAGYFRSKVPPSGRAPKSRGTRDMSPSAKRRVAWHLPDDFSRRSLAEQEKILEWVNRVIISGSTDYRRFQANAMKQRYAVRFQAFRAGPKRADLPAGTPSQLDDVDAELESAVVNAPAALEAEMSALLRFKTSTLAAFGYQRNGVWNDETASQKVEHLGLMFGALASDPRSTVKGYGVPLSSLCFAMLVFPAVWDFYLQWRERRRGFYTAWEVDMLSVALGLIRSETGWLRQNPGVSDRLVPIEGLISVEDIAEARTNWNAVCDAMHSYGRSRIRELKRVSRVHRDPFEPILAVLESDSPVGEYRKITEEILARMPDERRFPKAAAEAVRSFLILRLGLHLGLRQRNLRELRFCPPGRTPTSERHLEDMKCGELRWSSREQGWEVLIPSVAFKNSTSSFFGSKPFRLVLPDLGNLYEMLESYVDRHRARLLGPATDPGTLFVKSVKQGSASAAYDQNTFYEAWRISIQRYGIYNPYTGKGAIVGLLPHGPHNVRDVLATHILKQTGSYEQASYAIQDTPDMVAKHYGRFLPQDKSALAAQILNRVWDAA